MHDNFFGNMAKETRALFDVADSEAPDFTMHLHGGGNTKNSILNTAYSPVYIKQIVRTLSLRIKEEAKKENMEFIEPRIHNDTIYPPPSFNFISAMHHLCGTVSFAYESNQGIIYDRKLKDWETIFSFEQILLQHYILFEQTIRYALELKGMKNLSF